MEPGPGSGEFELIARIRERIERAGAPARSDGLLLASGDDATVTLRDEAAVISVDALVENTHFRIPPFSHADVGHKALATALSDLAAMGATARDAYVQLGVPDGVGEQRLLELADGLGAVAAEFEVAVVGGDVAAASELIVAVTAVGAGDADRLVSRAGAAAGDVVAVTGELGGAAAGLVLLERPPLAERLDPAVAAAQRRRQLNPRPQLAAGRALAGAGATAMIDISDGLGADAGHLAEASGVAIRIELDRVPAAAGVAETAAAAGLDPLELIAAGGEDYELLVAIAPDRLAAAASAVGRLPGLTAIGVVEPGTGVTLSGAGGAAPSPSGFDQLRDRRGRGGPA